MTPIFSSETTVTNRLTLKINDVDLSISSLGSNMPAVLPLLLHAPSGPAYYDDSNGQEGLVFTLRKIDHEKVKELLLFMLDKNWLPPSSDIQAFLKNGHRTNGCATPTQSRGDGKPVLEKNSNEAILNTKNEFLKCVNEAIEEHIDDENFRPSCLAKKIFLCEMQLHRKLKKLAGLSPSNYIRKYRLQRSLDYLKQEKWLVSEVCFKVGFRSLEYFSRSFKKEFGLCPSDYKCRC